MDGLVLGVDVATADVRALAVDGQGNVHAEASVPLAAPSSPEPGWSEQDPAAWESAVVAALAGVAHRLGDRAGSVVGLAVCGTSGTVVALDGCGRPLGPALMYNDQRAVEEAERCGMPATSGLPKWLWLLDHHGRDRVARLAHAPDVVVACLAGRTTATDWSHALKSGFDPGTEQWSQAALDAVPAELLPEVRRPASAVGTLSAETAEATGLPESCEVRLGMTDACAAQVAAGASQPGRFMSVLGTTLAVKGASSERIDDGTGAVYSHRHPDGWWLPGGASNTGAGVLREGFGDCDLAAMDEQAAAHGPARAVVYPLRGRGERFPFSAPDAGAFTLGDVSDEVERYRATLEGVAFVERLGYERLAELGARVEPPVAAGGGGSRSRVWNQIRAAVLDRALVEVPDASTARGAAILAAAGTLHPDLATATEAMAAKGEEVGPVGDDADALAASYERFAAAVRDRGWC
jgi:sugar (pentulose or hexulose) kinase